MASVLAIYRSMSTEILTLVPEAVSGSPLNVMLKINILDNYFYIMLLQNVEMYHTCGFHC